MGWENVFVIQRINASIMKRRLIRKVQERYREGSIVEAVLHGRVINVRYINRHA